MPPSLLPSLLPDTRTYAIGDIHGCLDILNSLLAWIEEDVRASSATHNVLIFMGDYVDRGPHIKQTIARLMGGFPFMQEVVYLRGNHEDTLLKFLNDEPITWAWLKFGGLVTLKSYGVKTTIEADQAGDLDEIIETALSTELNRLFPDDHRHFLENNLITSWTNGDYFFAHAGVRPGVPLADQVDHDLIWIRDDFMHDDTDHGKMIIHGHTITDKPDIHPNRIGIDTGVFSRGLLTCLVLEGCEKKFVFTTEDGVQVADNP